MTVNVGMVAVQPATHAVWNPHLPITICAWSDRPSETGPTDGGPFDSQEPSDNNHQGHGPTGGQSY